MQNMKQREDIKFGTIWGKTTIIGDSIGIELTKPRKASNSKFRSNAGCDHSGITIDYYRRNVTILSLTIVYSSLRIDSQTLLSHYL